MDVAGKRVTVLGLGRFGGGVGVAKWLCSRGARVTVSDQAPAEKLAESVAALAGLDITLHLGGQQSDDFTTPDLLVVSPAVPPQAEPIRLAAAAKVPRTTEINLFIVRCPAQIVGITGSVGKSTTTAMTGQVLASKLPTHVGGNIGRSLLSELGQIRPDHAVVLELSSFQLDELPEIGISPHVALVTNLLPNHLDRHGTMEAYGQAKKNIFRFQRPGDVLVLSAADELTRNWAREAAAGVRVEYFDPAAEQFELSVVGEHNQTNAQAAWAAARQFGVSRDQAATALKAFAGLRHRLQFVAEIGGVRYFNDSKCTTPQGAIVALESFPPRSAVMIVGGYDKHISFDALGAALAGRVKAVVTVGATAGAIASAVKAAIAAGRGQADSRHAADSLHAADSPTVIAAESFEQAVALARQAARPGEAVVLSPACASYDMFHNYEERGDAFAKLVRERLGG
jgi:UDP-N-acetylmuramoylalanine--D-glutamate ligase